MAESLESDLALSAANEASRMPRIALTLAWWSIVSAMFFIYVAAALALRFGVANAFVGIVAAIVVFSVIAGVLARYAVRTGLGTFLLSKVIFGRTGAALATLILFTTAIYFAVFEGAVLVSAAVKIVPGLSYEAACAIVVLYSTPLIIGSVQHWLNRFNGILMPFYVLGLLAAVGLALYKYGYSDRWLDLGPADAALDGRWWDCFVAYLGNAVIFMFSQDYARFGQRKDETYHAVLNFGYPFYAVAYGVNGAVGLFLVGTTQLANVTESSVVDAFVAVLGGAATLAFVWVTQTRINTANYYVATINMQAFFESIAPIRASKVVWAVLVGVVVLALMLATDVLSYVLVALAYQGAFVSAWVGVALAHVLRVPSGATAAEASPEALARLPAVDVVGMIAWLCGAASSLALMQTSGFSMTLATPAALVISALAYALLRRYGTAGIGWSRSPDEP
jgi:purine-cytosine permease-like protein